MVFHYMRIRSTIHGIRHQHLCHKIHTDIDTHTNEFTTSASSMPDSLQYSNTQAVETPAPSVDNSPATSSPVDALVRPFMPANRSLRFLESGTFGPPQISTSRLERRCLENVHRQHGLVIFLGAIANGLALTTRSTVSS